MTEWRCIHCGDTGLVRVREYDAAVRIETREYDSPCHACPAGEAWRDAIAALAVLDGDR